MTDAVPAQKSAPLANTPTLEQTVQYYVKLSLYILYGLILGCCAVILFWAALATCPFITGIPFPFATVLFTTDIPLEVDVATDVPANDTVATFLNTYARILMDTKRSLITPTDEHLLRLCKIYRHQQLAWTELCTFTSTWDPRSSDVETLANAVSTVTNGTLYNCLGACTREYKLLDSHKKVLSAWSRCEGYSSDVVVSNLRVGSPDGCFGKPGLFYTGTTNWYCGTEKAFHTDETVMLRCYNDDKV